MRGRHRDASGSAGGRRILRSPRIIRLAGALRRCCDDRSRTISTAPDWCGLNGDRPCGQRSCRTSRSRPLSLRSVRLQQRFHPMATRQRSLGMMRSGDWRRCWSLTDLGRFTIVRQRCIQLHGAVAEVAPVGRAQQALPCGVALHHPAGGREGRLERRPARSRGLTTVRSTHALQRSYLVLYCTVLEGAVASSANVEASPWRLRQQDRCCVWCLPRYVRC